MALSASNIQAVYALLSSALSADESIRKPAESSLSQCENRPGFCSCLLEIIAAGDRVSQVEIRLLASVYFKNSIARYWRQRRDSPGISYDEKTHIRKKLMLHVREENPKIALQLAVLVAKIARTDYPKEWPDLFSSLAQQLQSTEILISHRGFMVLFQTLKELASKRLNSDQRIFSEIAAQLFDYCWKHWQCDAQSILQNFGALSQGFTANSSTGELDHFYLVCERWLLCSKIIRLLVISGKPSDVISAGEVHFVKEVCPRILDAVQSFLPYYSSFLEGHPKLWEFVKRVCVKLMKILVAVQARHPYSFGDRYILVPVVEFCLNKIVNPDQVILSFEQLLIQCMIMVKSILECKEYKQSTIGRVRGDTGATPVQRKMNISITTSEMLSTTFSSERVILLCDVMIRRYFVFTTKDLDEWKQNAESFHHEQDMTQWDEKLRPCAEALYIVLFENFRNVLAPVIISILRDAMSHSPPVETEITPGMLLKDAAYTAAGHVYYELSSYLNFDEWFKGTLVLELSNCHPNMSIIHRKIALVLGQWVAEALMVAKWLPAVLLRIQLLSKCGTSVHFEGIVDVVHTIYVCWRIFRNYILIYFREGPMPLLYIEEDMDANIKGDTRKLVYCALVRLLQHHDVAVKLATCRSLCFVIQDCNFSGEDFHDFLSTCFTSCFKLVEDTEEFDSKVQVLNLISVLIEHAAVKIIPFADQLTIFFQKIWEESGGESLLRIQLLAALRNFICSLGYQSPACYPMLLPILRMGIDINGPDELNLLEDSVLLWESTLSNAPAMVNQLLEIFPYLLAIMERSLNHLQVAVNIIEDYIICGGTEFLNMHASQLVKLLDFIVGNVNDKGLLSTLPVIELLIQLYPVEVPPLISGILKRLLVVCLGPDNDDLSKTALRTASGAILARLLVMNSNYLAHLASDTSLAVSLQQEGLSINHNVLISLVDVLLDKIDNITMIQRKTYALALSVTLTLRQPEVIDKLDEILSVCTSVILGAEDPNDESSVDSISSDGGDGENFNGDAIPRIELRKRQIRASDPMKQLSLENMLRENLQACATLHGDASFNAAINSIHPSALAQLKQALKMP